MTQTNGNGTYNITAKETAPTPFNHINGTIDEVLSRLCITELCKGWPVYRDASEWRNYRELFTENAYVFTTWSGGLQIDDFIEVSKKGREKGDFIMHRENGTLADVNLPMQRGIGKMKATISQRFLWDGVSFDVECDCRFIFFCKRVNYQWKAEWVKLFYERDKVVPVDGKNVPTFTEEELAPFPEGYKYLGAAQGKLGHKILKDLPNMENEGFYKMYDAMEQWLKGEDVDLRWEHTG